MMETKADFYFHLFPHENVCAEFSKHNKPPKQLFSQTTPCSLRLRAATQFYSIQMLASYIHCACILHVVYMYGACTQF